MLTTIRMALPSECEYVLRAAQTVCEFAVIAGGCPRDLYFNKRYNDIDIWTSPDFDDQRYAAALGNEWDVIFERESDAAKYDATLGSRNHQIWSAERLCTNTKAQIMVWHVVPTTASVLGRFDFGICQIAHDGQCAYVTNEFMQDAAQQTITYLKPVDQWQYSMRHMHKLQPRYREFLWKVPT